MSIIVSFVAIFFISIIIGIFTNEGVAVVVAFISYFIWHQYFLAKDYLKNGDNGATKRRTKKSNEYFRKYGKYTFLDDLSDRK